MRGKLLTNDPAEIAAIEQQEHLCNAIAKLSDFIDGFGNIAPEEFKINPEEIEDISEEMKRYRMELLQRKNRETEEILKESPAELFTGQCEKARRIDPAISQIKVASKERARTLIILEELEALPLMKRYYLDHPIYEMITDQETGYLKYLNDILGQKQPGGSTDLNFERLPSIYSKEQMGRIFDKCHYLGLTKTKDRENFISMFTYPEEKHQEGSRGSSGKVFWRGNKKEAKAPLYGMMHRITGRVLTAATLRIYFDSNHVINDNQYQKDKETGDYPHPKLCDMIFAGVEVR